MNLRKLKKEYWELSIEYKKLDIKVLKFIHDLKGNELRNTVLRDLDKESKIFLTELVKNAVLKAKIDVQEEVNKKQEKLNKKLENVIKKEKEE